MTEFSSMFCMSWYIVSEHISLVAYIHISLITFKLLDSCHLDLYLKRHLRSIKEGEKKQKPILKAMCFHCFCQWKLSFKLYNWKAMQWHKILREMRNISVTASQPTNQNIMHCLSQIIAGFPSHFNLFVSF